MKKLDILIELFCKGSAIYYTILTALCIFDLHIPTRMTIIWAFINLSIFFWTADFKFKGDEDVEEK